MPPQSNRINDKLRLRLDDCIEDADPAALQQATIPQADNLEYENSYTNHLPSPPTLLT